jgi:hypothetical protein
MKLSAQVYERAAEIVASDSLLLMGACLAIDMACEEIGGLSKHDHNLAFADAFRWDSESPERLFWMSCHPRGTIATRTQEKENCELRITGLLLFAASIKEE